MSFFRPTIRRRRSRNWKTRSTVTTLFASLRLETASRGICSDGLSNHQIDWLQDMMEGREWYWVASDLPGKPEPIEGAVVPHMMLSGIKFRAEPVRAPVANEIAGGLHPVAQVSHYGHLVRGRCFVSNGMRMILPSLGDYSAGTNVLSSAFDPLLGQGRAVRLVHIAGACLVRGFASTDGGSRGLR